MLKQRVLTAIALIPLVLVAIFVMPATWFLALLGIIVLAGAREYVPLTGISGAAGGYALVGVQAIALTLLFAYRDDWAGNITPYAAFACVAWLLIFARLPLYRPGVKVDTNYKAISALTALVSITTGWCALGWLRMQPDGSWLLLLFLLIVWAADTGAYFAGINFGKRKLAPSLSPGKTRAGFVGGLVAASLVGLLAASVMPIASIELTWLLPVSVLTALASVGGDLVISLHKRTSGCKDSGSILPGHGGVLDRLDSLLAASPFFVLGLSLPGF